MIVEYSKIPPRTYIFPGQANLYDFWMCNMKNVCLGFWVRVLFRENGLGPEIVSIDV